jgi:hypothetical protein
MSTRASGGDVGSSTALATVGCMHERMEATARSDHSGSWSTDALRAPSPQHDPPGRPSACSTDSSLPSTARRTPNGPL